MYYRCKSYHSPLCHQRQVEKNNFFSCYLHKFIIFLIFISLGLINSKLVYSAENSESASDLLNSAMSPERPSSLTSSTDAGILRKERVDLKRNSSSKELLDKIISDTEILWAKDARRMRDSMSSMSSISSPPEESDEIYMASSTSGINHSLMQDDSLITTSDALLDESHNLFQQLKSATQTYKEEIEELEAEGKQVHYGLHSQVDADIGTAIGFQAKVHKNANNSVAIGDYSEANVKNVVSVGNSASKRKIVHVEHGRRNSDAATVGQVKSMAVLYDENSDDPEFDKITLSKKPDGNKLVKISGVAPAKSDNDAVNQGQINDLIMHITPEEGSRIMGNMGNVLNSRPIYMVPEIPEALGNQKIPASILMGGRQIRGVEAGTAENDVVVMGQLEGIFRGAINVGIANLIEPFYIKKSNENIIDFSTNDPSDSKKIMLSILNGIAPGDSDYSAVNKGQLDLLDKKFESLQRQNSLVKFSHDKESVSFISKYNNPVILSGIADGIEGNDAVNRQQLDDEINKVNQSLTEKQRFITNLDNHLYKLSNDYHDTRENLKKDLSKIIEADSNKYRKDLQYSIALTEAVQKENDKIKEKQEEFQEKLEGKVSKTHFDEATAISKGLSERREHTENNLFDKIFDLSGKLKNIEKKLDISIVKSKNYLKSEKLDDLFLTVETVERRLDRAEINIDSLNDVSMELKDSIDTINLREIPSEAQIKQAVLDEFDILTGNSPLLPLSRELSDSESQSSDNENPHNKRNSMFFTADNKQTFSPYPTFSSVMGALPGNSDIHTDNSTKDDPQSEDDLSPPPKRSRPLKELSIDSDLANSVFRSTVSTEISAQSNAENRKTEQARKGTAAEVPENISTQQTVLDDTDMVAEAKQTVLINKDLVAVAKQTVLADTDTVAEAKQTVLADKDTVAEARQTVLTDKSTVSVAKQIVLADTDMVAAAKKTVLTDKDTVSEARRTVLTDKDVVAEAKQTILANKGMVAEAKQTVLADKGTVSEAKQTVLTDKDRVAVARQTVLTDKDRVAVAKQTVLADTYTVAEAKQTVLTDKDTVAEAKQTILANKDVAVESTQTILAFEKLAKNMAASAFPSGSHSNAVLYDDVQRNSATLGGPDSEAPVKLSNVAPAKISEDSTDAVNGAQLFQSTLYSMNKSMQYTDQRFSEVAQGMNDIRQSINNVANHAYSGVAAAMAMPSMGPTRPGGTMVSIGTASFKGRKATGVGVTYRSRGGQMIINAAASKAGSDTGMRVQVGYEF